MDDEKSIAEKLTDVITKATDSVKSTMSNIVDTASQAAEYAMENNAERMSRQTAAELAPRQIAVTANKHVYIPVATDAAAMPAPLVAVQPMPRKRTPRTKLSSGKTPAKKAVAKEPNRKAGKKAAKKAAKKSAPKKSKKSAKKSAGKKTAKRAANKSAKKARKTKNKSKR
jgi:hypothetical protein